jgi:hypothetical protein
MSDHYHYDYASTNHDHRGQYAADRHDHYLDYAEKYHRHHDDESAVRGLREDLSHAEQRIRELEDDLRDALERIRALEDRQPDYASPVTWPIADELAGMSMHDQEMWQRRCAEAEADQEAAPKVAGTEARPGDQADARPGAAEDARRLASLIADAAAQGCTYCGTADAPCVAGPPAGYHLARFLGVLPGRAEARLVSAASTTRDVDGIVWAASPKTAGYDPGPAADDEGGMSEYRYVLPEDYERGQS